MACYGSATGPMNSRKNFSLRPEDELMKGDLPDRCLAKIQAELLNLFESINGERALCRSSSCVEE